MGISLFCFRLLVMHTCHRPPRLSILLYFVWYVFCETLFSEFCGLQWSVCFCVFWYTVISGGKSFGVFGLVERRAVPHLMREERTLLFMRKRSMDRNGLWHTQGNDHNELRNSWYNPLIHPRDLYRSLIGYWALWNSWHMSWCYTSFGKLW